MASKRTPLQSFSELEPNREFEPKGRKAILRSAEEVQAEEALLLNQDTPTLHTAETAAPDSPRPADVEPIDRANVSVRTRDSRKPATSKNVLASQADSQHASALASYHDSYPSSVIETIRKIVKVPGKDVSFVRLTLEEKNQLADIVYTYKRQGKKTTENEINRIAVNFILEDYKANGANSILARVIAALLA